MKAALIFNLPEDQCKFEIASSAMKWALTVLDIDNLLRNRLKYEHNIPTADEAFELVRRELHTALEDRNISLDMIE